MSDVVVVLPALNEEATISELVTELRRSADVVVVDDGSSDGTGERARSAGATVVHHEVNIGYDRALRSGIEWALDHGYAFVATMDADGQHDPGLVDGLVAPLRRGEADIALGVRHTHGRWSERLFNAYTRRRFDVPDILCGAKAYTAATCRAHLDSMGELSIGTGLALAALRAGARASQHPITVQPRSHGATRFGHGMKAELRILRALGGAVGRDLA